ncbi:unnamed protein product [Absidia cylindrospora]
MTPIACFVLPWKKKRENRSKSIIMPTLTTSDFGFSSVASLPLTRSNIIVDEGEDDIQSNKSVQPLPPYYYDHTVPSTFITQNQRSQDQQQHLTTSCYKINQRQYTVERREEEGKEDLPPYECTVYKMGFMMIKNELDGPNKKSRRRSWRYNYYSLQAEFQHVLIHFTPLFSGDIENYTWYYGEQQSVLIKTSRRQK